jgi:hypothetical protein
VVNTLIRKEGLFTVNKNFSNKVKNAAAAHRASLQKNLEHRIEVATANGDQALVRQLEQEASYLNLN